jgi:hypothetical protein
MSPESQQWQCGRCWTTRRDTRTRACTCGAPRANAS